MAKKIETYEVVRHVIMNNEHRVSEMKISLPKLQWMGADYQPPAPAPIKTAPKKYDISSRAPSKRLGGRR